MRYGAFRAGDELFPGRMDGEQVVRLRGHDLFDVIAQGIQETGERYPLSQLHLTAPYRRPSKILAIGLNYPSHIRETKMQAPEEPFFFSKPSSAIIGPEEPIRLPPQARRVDYEGEVVAIIGRLARASTDGASHIFGYSGFNDVTARDLQKQDRDWSRAKGFDTFAPFGPLVSTEWPRTIATRHNGAQVQHANTGELLFPVPRLVEHLSQVMTLYPGDLIATGTPAGIGPLKAGDTIEVEADGCGVLRNPVVEGPRPHGGAK